MTTGVRQRISKLEFLRRVGQRAEQPANVVSEVYEAIIAELVDGVTRGDDVVLTAFGRFYRQDHKGHKVRFGKDDVEGYSVLKFSASPSVNRRLRDDSIDLSDAYLYDFAAEPYDMLQAAG